MEVLNYSIRGFHNRINRFIEEMAKASSANGSEINDFTKTRLIAYLSSLRHYHDYIMSEQPLDLVETSPKVYPLRPNPEVPIVENEMLNDIMEKFVLMRDELNSSQSARDPSGLKVFDSIRMLSYIANIENYVTQYVNTSSPLDLPKSSPRADLALGSRTGIKPGGN